MVAQPFCLASSLSLFYPATSVVRIITFFFLCMIAAGVVFFLLIVLGIYILIEHVFPPFWGMDICRDLELGQPEVWIQPPNIYFISSPNAATNDASNRGHLLSMDILGRRRQIIELHEIEEERKIALERLLPLVSFRTRENRSKSSDCATCLDDFVDGECWQVFPACRHMFHSACIDRWLRCQLSCPVCRSSVLNV